MFDVIERGPAVQGVATIPEFFWELSFGIYLIVKGFRTSAIPVGDDSHFLLEAPTPRRP
jgi:hypothetical protein